MRIRHMLLPVALACSVIAATNTVRAHFQELIPSNDRVTPGERRITLDLLFTHPMTRGPAMEMAKPRRFGVMSHGKIEDLLPRLREGAVDGKTAWYASYRFSRRGNYAFFVEPQPYWEAAEGKMIVHFAKVIVDAFSAGVGWHVPVGLPVEIQPLARPYDLWAGNVFRGRVLKDGKPVPGAVVEVEWLNDGSLSVPAAAYETQVIHADEQGLFVYGLPRAGWWGFSALVDGDAPMKDPQGRPVPVEQGGVLWLHARDMK
jgi:cobalt/nickel transport protein